MLYST
jgi:tetratricopeptide (TPR) repeat protein